MSLAERIDSRTPPTNLKAEAQKVYHQAIRRQKALLAQGEFKHFNHQNGVVLLAEYLSSTLLQDTFTLAEKEIRVGKKDDFFINFAGKAFADVAFAYCSAKEAKRGNIVLSPHDTLAVLKALHPHAAEVDNGFGNIGLIDPGGKGIYVPDGLLVKNNNIIGVLEYSLSNRIIKIDEQYAGFFHLKEELQHLMDFPQFVLVGHTQSKNGVAHLYPDLQYSIVPVKGSDVMGLVTHYIYGMYRPTNSHATLSETEQFMAKKNSNGIHRRG